MSYLPPMPRDIVKRSKRAVVTHLFCGDPPPGRREYLAALDSRGYNAKNDFEITIGNRSRRLKKAREAAK